MANASAKKIAAQNEVAIRNLNIGIALANVNYFLFRYLFNKPPFNRGQLALYILTLIPSVVIYRYLVAWGTPQRDESGLLITPGEDLSQPGLIEWSWDVLYVTWACHIGSALFGRWFWYFYLVIPGYAAFKLFGLAQPTLRGLMGGLGRGNPQDGPVEGAPASESKRQAKLRKRSERGDPRIKSVQRPGS